MGRLSKASDVILEKSLRFINWLPRPLRKPAGVLFLVAFITPILMILVLRGILFITPFIVLMLVAIQYTVSIFGELYSQQHYQILLGGMGVTTALAGLALGLSTACKKDDQASDDFYHAGERLTH